jgi:hypothetical protein
MKWFFVIFVMTCSTSRAQEELISAERKLHVDYRHYERIYHPENGKSKRITPLNSAKFLKNHSQLPKVTMWRSHQDLQHRFEKIRDERFLFLKKSPHFPRRISWLYPKDGCFARAALVSRHAFRNYIPIPNKIFAFGNLRVKTPYARRGVVGWWCHVAPMVQVDENKYVLDPSIEATRPLLLNEWLRRMGKPENIKIAICRPGTYSPGDNCIRETDGLELRAMETQKHYLELEEVALRGLGRDPKIELGETPPWQREVALR